MIRRTHPSALLLGFAVLAAGDLRPATAATELQGYYETNFQGSRSDDTWQLDRPRHFFELRLLTTPLDGAEAFLKTYAESNRFAEVNSINRHEPKFFFAEGHVKFRSGHTELLAFTKQNRFWFSQPLLQVIDGNRFGGARAVRVDFWDTYGFQGLAYYGDQTNTSFVNEARDFVVTRITRPSFDRRVQFGGTFGRLDRDFDTSSYEMASAVDVELALGELVPGLHRLGRTTAVIEAGRNFSGVLEDTENRNAIEAELRDVHLDALTFKLNGWYRESNSFTDNLSSRAGSDDRRGLFLESYYRLPRKQIDLRYTYLRESTIEEANFGPSENDILDYQEHTLETYLELKGGFNGRIKYRTSETNAAAQFPEFEELLFEIQGQNKLISVRPQVRLKSLGQRNEVQGYGMEINFNLTDDWKFFARFLNAEENAESRRTTFLQAQFRGFRDAEFFLEYGDGGRSDRLAENDGYVNESSSALAQNDERRVQLRLKYWF